MVAMTVAKTTDLRTLSMVSWTIKVGVGFGRLSSLHKTDERNLYLHVRRQIRYAFVGYRQIPEIISIVMRRAIP
jgi:hypothetical protein